VRLRVEKGSANVLDLLFFLGMFEAKKERACFLKKWFMVGC
jgi:hypothetical protein